MEAEIIGILLTVFATFLGSAGGFMLKSSSKKFKLKLKKFFDIKLLSAFFIYFLSALVFLIALKFGRLTMLYPIGSLTYIWTTMIAAKYLNEPITKYKIIGISLIIIGVVFVTQ